MNKDWSDRTYPVYKWEAAPSNSTDVYGYQLNFEMHIPALLLGLPVGGEAYTREKVAEGQVSIAGYFEDNGDGTIYGNIRMAVCLESKDFFTTIGMTGTIVNSLNGNETTIRRVNLGDDPLGELPYNGIGLWSSDHGEENVGAWATTFTVDAGEAGDYFLDFRLWGMNSRPNDPRSIYTSPETWRINMRTGEIQAIYRSGLENFVSDFTGIVFP